MNFCNWYTVNENYFQHGLFQGNCMDISTANLVKMDNKMNNLIQHTLIGDHVSKNGIKAVKEIDANEAYNILWKSLQFLKGLSELQKVYKKLRNEPDLDKKVDFLKTKDKLLRKKPLRVLGLKVTYSETSLSISEEDQLPPFKKALLTDTLPTELKEKRKRTKQRSKIKKKEIPKPTPIIEQKIDEEPKDVDAPVVKPGRTTSNKKDYEKIKKKKMAELKKLFPDPPKIIKKVDIKEEEEPLEEIYPEPEEEQFPIEEAIEEEEVIEEVKPIIKPPKPKKRIIKKIKKKEPPKEEPKPPPFKLRQPLPTDKRRVSESDAVKPAQKSRKRRWTYDDGITHRPSKIDLSPLNMKMPEPPIKLRKPQPGDKRRASESDAVKPAKKPRKRRWTYDDGITHRPSKIDLSPLNMKMPEPPIRLRKPQPGDKRRVSDSDSKKRKKEDRQARKRRWSYSYGGGSSMGKIELDRSPLNIKLPKRVPSIVSLTSEKGRSSRSSLQIGKLRLNDPKKEQQRKLKTVGKLKLPEAFAGH